MTDMTNQIGFIREHIEKPIVFIGMMGAGKTTIACKCAQILNFQFLDSDLEMEKDQGRKIKDIFAAEGEFYFRNIEGLKIRELIKNGQVVLSVGGGAVTIPETADTIFSNALCVWIDAPIKILAQRAGDASTRPLLAGGDVEKLLEERMKARRPLYERAHIRVDGTPSIDAVAVNVIGQVYDYLVKETL